MLKQLQTWACLTLVSLLLSACTHEKIAPDDRREDNLTLGNPSGAHTHLDNFLVEKPQYALSYNTYRGTPNWVSWHLSGDWLGDAPRQDNFRADISLPASFYRVIPNDYTNSGFDRGHNVPSADRTLTAEDNSATFLMSNIIPQAPLNNQQTWASLESYCRKLVREGNELYIIMGNYGMGGTGSNGFREKLADGKVIVPSNIWKVIVVLPSGTDDLVRVGRSTRVIAVDIPNTNDLNSNWGVYRTTVDHIEASMGYNLLSNVPEAFQRVIEARIDDGPTS